MDGSSTVPTPDAQPVAPTTGSECRHDRRDYTPVDGTWCLDCGATLLIIAGEPVVMQQTSGPYRYEPQTKLPPMATEPENPKDRHGISKPPLSCVPCPVLLEVGAVMRYGADKYGRHNWRDHKVIASVYYDAAMRHLFQWWEGCDDDDDSGLPHLSHAIASLVVLRDALIRDMAQDDRPPPCPAGWVEAIKGKMR